MYRHLFPQIAHRSTYLMVLCVVNVHRGGIHVRLQSGIVIGQGGEGEGHVDLTLGFALTPLLV